ncbi:MAG: phospholipid carrier-dependent glycosyltransferase [Myxococcales bacterium]|nr:phospholipid carrier-dependent glycosyltransferase [Myxococcales bacterium]
MALDPTSPDSPPGARPSVAPFPNVAPLPSVALLMDPADVPLFSPSRTDRLWRWGVIGAIYLLYLLNCGSFGLWDPWETHYGEVTRNMVETFDWVNPWWGYQRKIGAEPIAGEWFYSKPIYIFWAECTFVRLIGLTDWALRLPQALLGASMAAATYLALERILSRTHAVYATLVVALSPFVYMVSRQAQTDMPFVATLTIGMWLVAVGFFGRRQPLTDRGFGFATLLWLGFALLNLGPQFAIIATDLYDPSAGAALEGLPALLERIQQNGAWHVAFYAPVAMVILLSVVVPVWRQRRQPVGWDDAFKDRWVRRYFLLAGYMLFAQATYSKGLLGFLLPSALLVLYFATTRTWGLLGRAELARGIPLFFVTVSPWYVAMFCRHGMPYYNRFFIHDHFNRVGAGVHQIDTGTFEYFVKWLGYGLFPWSALIPAALLGVVGFVRAERLAAGRADPVAFEAAAVGHVRVLGFLWFLFAFFLFTLSSTRFHHYILPGVPAIGTLVGLWLVDQRRSDQLASRVGAVLGLGIFVAVLANLVGDYQNLRNLFTYKYDRPLPESMPIDWAAAALWPSDANPIVPWAGSPFARHVGPMVAQVLSISWFRWDTFWPIAGGAAGAGLLLLVWRPLRGAGMVVLTASAALVAFWALNWYMPTLAPHWSQKYLFEAYYEDCSLHPNPPLVDEAFTPLVRRMGLGFIADALDAKPKRVCREDVVSWLITWRGETYYSNNEIRPLNKATQLTPYLKEMNRGKKFYTLLERGRTSGFESKLKAESRKLRDDGDAGFVAIKDWTVDLISNDSAYFVMARCTPVADDGKDPPPSAKPRGAARPLRALPTLPLLDRASSPNPSF